MSTDATGSATDAATRPRLSRERVLSAAVALADEHGVEWLSMRKLAAQLGFEVMALYNHVANKNALIEGMVELVAGEVAQPLDGVGWSKGIRDMAVSTHDLLLRHAWAVELWTRAFPGPTRFGQMERLLGLLVAGGFAGHLGDLGFHAINMHVVGFTQQQLGYRIQEASTEAMLERFEREVSPERFPLMVAHKQYHDDIGAGDTDDPDEFSYVLDMILDGLERARDAVRVESP